MTDDTTPLSPRHERFVAEYLKDLNATQAYIRAGYAPRGAAVNASKLLKQPRIEVAVAAGKRRIAQALEVTVERMAAEYARIAFANIDDFIAVGDDGRVRVDLAKTDRAQRAGLLELTVTDYGEGRPQRVRIKLGKLQALEALARRADMFVAKPEPGLTPEDRTCYEARIANAEGSFANTLKRLRSAAHERDEARVALAAAEAKLKAAGIGTSAVPSPPPPASEASADLPPIVLQGLGPPDTPRPKASQPPGTPPPPAPRRVPVWPEPGWVMPARGTAEHNHLLNLLKRGRLDSADALKVFWSK